MNGDFLFTGLNAGLRYVPSPSADPNARPTRIDIILLERFGLDDVTLHLIIMLFRQLLTLNSTNSFNLIY